jgi:hypothetical protein
MFAPSAAHNPSPAAMMDIDASVFDGMADNAALVKIHQALNDGLVAKGLSTPNRYRPGQSLNPDLLDVASEILKPFTSEHSEDVIGKVIDEAFSVGALQPLIEDSEVREIYLNGAHQLVYHQTGQSHSEVVNSPFSSVEQAQRAALRILNGLGREGEQRGEGRLGDFRVLIDLNGAEGPYICLQRPIQSEAISSTDMMSSDVSPLVLSALASGARIAIASRSSRVQAKLASAIALEALVDQRVAVIGASHHLGNSPSWLTVDGNDEALETVEQLSPSAIIIQDQAGLTGEKVFEVLSASSKALLLLSARDISSAVSKIRRRAGDDNLAFEGVDFVIFAEESSEGITVSDIYSLIQGAHAFS